MSNTTARLQRFACVGAWCVLLCGAPAEAQRFIAATAALTATQEAANIYLHSIELDWGEPLPGRNALPGVVEEGPLLLSPDAEHLFAAGAWLPRGSIMRPETTLCVFSTVRFGELQQARRPSAFGWREWPVAALPDAAGAVVVLLGERQLPGAGMVGKLEMLLWDADAQELHPGALQTWELPGQPVAAVHDPKERGEVAVLYQSDDGPALALAQLDTGAMQDKPLLNPGDERLELSASGLAWSEDGRWLLVMLRGFSPREPARPLSSWLYQLDAQALEVVGGPVHMPGAAQWDVPALYLDGAARCWAVTQEPGAGFAHAARLLLTPEGPHKELEHALGGIQHPLRLAVAPDGGDVAAALDRRLEIWVDGRRPGPAHAYAERIRALNWSEEALALGEGRRLHTVDPADGAPLQTVEFSTGHVAALALVPQAILPPDDWDGDGLSAAVEAALGTDPNNPDTAGDGIHDGVDPQPALPSPRLLVDEEVLLHGDAVGRQLKTLRIATGGFPDAPWQIRYDRTEMPWLVIHPLSGRGDGFSHMGVDPSHYAPGAPNLGYLEISLLSPGLGLHAAGSPVRVPVRVLPPRGPLRQILWVWPDTPEARLRAPGSPHPFAPLAELLAAPPHLFAHVEATGVYTGDLSVHSIVVLPASAVAQGAVTRQAMLDYLLHGGAILFYGESLDATTPPEAMSADEGVSPLAQWLQPLGVHLDPRERVHGVFDAPERAGLTQHWEAFAVQEGSLLFARPEDILVPGPAERQAIFAARDHGFGRIALLAAATPLSGRIQDTPQRARFAAQLFEWLARASMQRGALEEQVAPLPAAR